MDFIIRVKHNYRNILLSAQGVVSGMSVLGSSVPVATRDGSSQTVEFRGFASRDDGKYPTDHLVKVLQVASLCDDSTKEVQAIPVGDYCVGVLTDNGVQLILKNERLVHYAHDQQPEIRSKAEVINLFDNKHSDLDK